MAKIDILEHYFVALKGESEEVQTFWVTARSRQGAIQRAQRFAGERGEVIDVTIHPDN